jgi:hypothetical protein
MVGVSSGRKDYGGCGGILYNGNRLHLTSQAAGGHRSFRFWKIRGWTVHLDLLAVTRGQPQKRKSRAATRIFTEYDTRENVSDTRKPLDGGWRGGEELRDGANQLQPGLGQAHSLAQVPRNLAQTAAAN